MATPPQTTLLGISPSVPIALSPDPCGALLLDETNLSRLANELARGLYEPEDVIKQYGLTEELFNERVMNNPAFMTFYAEAHAIWHSSSKASERVAAKAGVVVEQWLREGNRLLHDPANPMAPKVELFKHLTKIAGMEPVREAEGAAGNGVSVTINLGHARLHPQTITIEKVIDGQAVEVAPTLPAQVTQGAAPTAASPVNGSLAPNPEHKATLAAFRDTQQRGGVVWPGSK